VQYVVRINARESIKKASMASDGLNSIPLALRGHGSENSTAGKTMVSYFIYVKVII
jgi:hypothetical protein